MKHARTTGDSEALRNALPKLVSSLATPPEHTTPNSKNATKPLPLHPNKQAPNKANESLKF